MQITTIGLDIAKNVFQVHDINAAEKVASRACQCRGERASLRSEMALGLSKLLVRLLGAC